MTYHELVEEVRAVASKKDASKITDHMAIQFNVVGEAEGAFYIEMYLGHIIVEPYEYYDHDILMAASCQDILDILDGKLNPSDAMNDDRIRVEGNIGRLKLFEEIINKTPVKKAPAKKAAAKKAPAKKTAAKKTPAKKTAAKKAEPAKKEEPKKAEPAKKEEPKKAEPAKKEEPKKAETAKKAEPAKKTTAKKAGK